MKHFTLTFIASWLLLMLFAPASFAQASATTGESMVATFSDNLEWNDYQPPGFGSGLRIAVVSGDPSVPDEPYVIRASFVDGFEIPAHYHPRTENLTMLQGILHMGMAGEHRDDADLQTYEAGDFLYIPGGHPHYGRVEGETIFQLHGIGPFQTILVDQPASQ